jgi:hypothetical protein
VKKRGIALVSHRSHPVFPVSGHRREYYCPDLGFTIKYESRADVHVLYLRTVGLLLLLDRSWWTVVSENGSSQATPSDKHCYISLLPRYRVSSECFHPMTARSLTPLGQGRPTFSQDKAGEDLANLTSRVRLTYSSIFNPQDGCLADGECSDRDSQEAGVQTRQDRLPYLPTQVRY